MGDFEAHLLCVAPHLSQDPPFTLSFQGSQENLLGLSQGYYHFFSFCWHWRTPNVLGNYLFTSNFREATGLQVAIVGHLSQLLLCHSGSRQWVFLTICSRVIRGGFASSYRPTDHPGQLHISLTLPSPCHIFSQGNDRRARQQTH